MNNPLEQNLETFTVEQGYYIGMAFFAKLWPLVEHIVYTGEDNMCWYFLIHIPHYNEHSAECNEAVCRVTGISKEKQGTLHLI